MPAPTDKYRLFPNSLFPNTIQAVALVDTLGSFCDLYNAGLRQPIATYQRRRRTLGTIDQVKQSKAVRRLTNVL